MASHVGDRSWAHCLGMFRPNAVIVCFFNPEPGLTVFTSWLWGAEDRVPFFEVKEALGVNSLESASAQIALQGIGCLVC